MTCNLISVQCRVLAVYEGVLPRFSYIKCPNTVVQRVFKYLYSAHQQPQANRGACGSISSKKRDTF